MEAEYRRTCHLSDSRCTAEFHKRKTIEHCIKGNLGLGSCQRCTQAVVDPHPESEMIAQVAVQPELVRVGEFPGVAVRSPKLDDDELARGNPHAGDFNVAGHPAGKPLHGAFVAQGLFDHRLHQTTIQAKLPPKPRLLRQNV